MLTIRINWMVGSLAVSMVGLAAFAGDPVEQISGPSLPVPPSKIVIRPAAPPVPTIPQPDLPRAPLPKASVQGLGLSEPELPVPPLSAEPPTQSVQAPPRTLPAPVITPTRAEILLEAREDLRQVDSPWPELAPMPRLADAPPRLVLEALPDITTIVPQELPVPPLPQMPELSDRPTPNIRPVSATRTVPAASAIPSTPSVRSFPAEELERVPDQVNPLPGNGSQLKLLMRLGSGTPRFEIRTPSGETLLFKVYGEKVEMLKSTTNAAQNDSPLTGVTATGKVRFVGPGVEGNCDQLTLLSGSGDVLIKGNIRMRTKTGRNWSEVSAEQLFYQIGTPEPSAPPIVSQGR